MKQNTKTMKPTNMKLRLLTAMLLLTLANGSAWAADVTWSHTIVSSDKVENNSITINGAKWTVETVTGTGSPTISNAKAYGKQGLKFGDSGNKYFQSITLSTDYFSSKKVSNVEVTLILGKKGNVTLTVKQGTTTIGSGSVGSSSEWQTLTANTTKGTSGALVLEITGCNHSVSISSIKVTYEACTGKAITASASPNGASSAGCTVTAPASACDGEQVTLSYEEGTGYYFGSWTVYSEDLTEYTVTDNTFTMPDAAVIVEGNFNACDALANPTVNISDITTSSATITWKAVANATGGYKVYVTDYVDFEKEETVTTTSYSLSGLSDDTEYAVSIKALGNNHRYCESAGAEVEFKTVALATYTITYNVNGSTYDTKTVTEGSAIGTLPADPTSCNSAQYPTFIGWYTTPAGSMSSPSTAAPTTQVTAETVPTGNVTYYAVFGNGTGGGNITFDVASIASNEGWESANAYTSYTISGVTLTYNGGGNNGKYYSSDNSWRLYNGGYIVASGGDFTSVKGYAGTTVYNFEKQSDGTWKYSTSETVKFTKFEIAAGTPSTAYISTCCTPTTTIALAASANTANIGETSSVEVTFTPSVTSGNQSGTWSFTTTGGNLSADTGSAPFTCTFSAAGTYTITANYNDGTSCPPAAVTQTVTIAAPVYLNIMETSLSLGAMCGGTDSKNVTLKGYNLETGKTIAISSNDAKVTVSPTEITVGLDGKVDTSLTVTYTATAGQSTESGTATITASYNNENDTTNTYASYITTGCEKDTVVFNDRGTAVDSKEDYAGIEIDAPSNPTGVCTTPVAYEFVGWSETPATAATSTKPTLVNFPYSIPAGGKTLYAVYRFPSDGGTGEPAKVGLSGIVDGGKYYITATSSEKEYILKNSTFSAGNSTAVEFNPTTIEESAAWTFTAQGTENSWYIQNSDDEYLSTTDGNNKVSCNTTTKVYWTASSVENSTCVKLKFSSYSRYLALLSNSNWRSYTSTNGVQSIQLYSTANYSYTTSPICGPYLQITGGRDVYVTSGNVARKNVEVQDTIYYRAGSLKAKADGSAPYVYVEKTAGCIHNVGDNTYNSGVEVIHTSTSSSSSDNEYTLTGYFVVRYTPSEANVNELVRIVPRVAYNTTASLDSATVHARSLPEKFVIAAKNGDKWYALPADMNSNSGTYQSSDYLEVDNAGNPTCATVAPCNTIYTFDGMKQGGDLRYVRFVGLGGKYLWASSSDTGIKNDATDPTADSKNYNWLLRSTDNVEYTFGNGATDRTLALSTNASTLNRFGMYANTCVNTLRILPVADTCAYNVAPTNLHEVSKKSTEVTIAWNAVAGADAYQYSLDNTNWTDCGATTQCTVTGQTASSSVTIYVRAKHGSATKVCSDVASISVTMPACDEVPEFNGGVMGTISESCGTLSLIGYADDIKTGTACAVTEQGIQYSSAADFSVNPVNVKLTAEQISATAAPDFATIGEPGTYYFRAYAVNSVGTGYSDQFDTVEVTSLAGLKLMFENDNNVAPLVGGKATKRVVYYSESSATITWEVKFQDGTQGTGSVDAQGNFTASAMGVYTVTATQAAADGYCGGSATATIEVRNAHYHSLITNCAALKNGNIEVVNQDSAYMDIVVDNAETVKVTIVRDNTGQNTGGSTGNLADELFFSKYYEATGNVKLIAIYNGTKSDVTLSNYKIKIGAPLASQNVLVDSAGHVGWSNEIDLSNYTIAAGKELIFWYYQGVTTDNSIVDCVNDKGVPTGTFIKNSNVVFGGRQSVVLTKDDNIIDVLGAITDNSSAALANPISGECKPSWGDTRGIYKDKDGDTKYDYAWCGTGLSIEDEKTVIDLSMNRCLLVRSNKVTSGANAVAKNVGVFNTFTPDEWLGRQVSKLHPVTGADDNGIQSSCDGFAFVANFDYASYFNRYEELGGGAVGETEAFAKRQDDGTYRIDASDLDLESWRELSCKTIKIQGLAKDKDGNDSTISELDYKVPIIVKHNANTNDEELFGFDGTGRATCPTCDVVIRDNAELTVVPKGYNELRDVYVYHTGRLRIPSGKTYSVRHVYISSRNNEVGYALVEGTLSATQGVGHYKSIDALAWYDFSLPYNCKVKDITRSNGLKILGKYTEDWWIKYYDGQKRAISGTPNGATPTNWELVDSLETLQAGVGYIIGIGGKHEETPRKAQYHVRITLPNVSGQCYTETGVSDQVRNVYGYTGAKAEELPCHRGWNYIGNPFISLFDGGRQEPMWDTQLLLSGYYKDMTDGETYTEDENIYVSVDQGTGGATDWIQSTATEADLLPFRAFFVQAVSDGQVGFVKAARTLPVAVSGNAPALPNPNDPSQFSLLISSESNGSSKATVKIGDYTPQYEVGHDLLRMINKSQYYPQLYTVDSVGYYMVYQAIDRTTPVEQNIALGYYTRSKGTFTISLGSMQNMDRYDAVLLTDNVEHTTTDLLLGNYTFTSGAGDVANRFSVRLRKSNISTDIEAQEGREPVVYRIGESIVIDQLPAGATVRVIDAVGRVLHQQQAVGEVLQFRAPVRGAYIIQVMSESQSYSIKTIL